MKVLRNIPFLLLPAMVCCSIFAPTSEQGVFPRDTPAKRELSLRADDDSHVLHYRGTERGKPVQGGVKLRILCVGDSITAGWGSWGSGNGYRERLRDNLSGMKITSATREGVLILARK